MNSYYSYTKLSIYVSKRFREIKGFGLVESILSIVLLTTLLSYSMFLISIRQDTMHKSNLTRAINDEIRRDIEKLKIELWNEHYKPPQGSNNAYYETGSSTNPNLYCQDIMLTITRLASWKNKTWTPGSNTSTQSGQIRNKVFTGRPVTIQRIVRKKRPLNLGTNSSIDTSIAEIIYRVNKKNENHHWTSIYLTSEAHGWCSPNNR